MPADGDPGLAAAKEPKRCNAGIAAASTEKAMTITFPARWSRRIVAPESQTTEIATPP